jgi:predicted Zn-dependent protease
MNGLFYDLGRAVGRSTIPAVRKAKWVWQGLTGNEEEVLRAEVAMGGALATEIQAVAPLVNDPATVQWVDYLGQRLSACLRDKRYGFRLRVIRADSPNAMALPGGFILISHGLLQFCECQAEELAFVIGHEMTHILRRHAWDRWMNQAVAQAASAIAARTGPLGGWLRQQGLGLLQSAYSQDQEFEADELGLRLSVAAGYSPAGAVALLRRLERRSVTADSVGPYFSSHPPPAERVARLMALWRQLSQGPRPG